MPKVDDSYMWTNVKTNVTWGVGYVDRARLAATNRVQYGVEFPNVANGTSTSTLEFVSRRVSR